MESSSHNIPQKYEHFYTLIMTCGCPAFKSIVPTTLTVFGIGITSDEETHVSLFLVYTSWLFRVSRCHLTAILLSPSGRKSLGDSDVVNLIKYLARF